VNSPFEGEKGDRALTIRPFGLDESKIPGQQGWGGGGFTYRGDWRRPWTTADSEEKTKRTGRKSKARGGEYKIGKLGTRTCGGGKKKKQMATVVLGQIWKKQDMKTKRKGLRLALGVLKGKRGR